MADPSDIAQLRAKLAEVMGAVDRIPKRGYNDHFGYSFATDGDVSEAIRKELSDRGVSVLTSTRLVDTREATTSSGRTTLLTDVEATLTFGYGDAELRATGVGRGEDSLDKGPYKAATGAVKYALMKTFLVPTGDDPEHPTQDTPEGAGAAAAGNRHPIPDAARVFTWPFGAQKGKPLSEMDDKSLTWFLENRKPDPTDTKWYQKNLRDYDTVRTEAEDRGLIHPELPVGT